MLNKEVRSLKLLPPVYGGRVGGRSRFKICVTIGYRPRTEVGAFCAYDSAERIKCIENLCPIGFRNLYLRA